MNGPIDVDSIFIFCISWNKVSGQFSRGTDAILGRASGIHGVVLLPPGKPDIIYLLRKRVPRRSLGICGSSSVVLSRVISRGIVSVVIFGMGL